MNAPQGLPGGANLSLTTSEQIFDLSALQGHEVALSCSAADWIFCFVPRDQTAAGTLVSTASAASLTAQIADPVGAGEKALREVLGVYSKIVAKISSGTGTLVIKPVRKV